MSDFSIGLVPSVWTRLLQSDLGRRVLALRQLVLYALIGASALVLDVGLFAALSSRAGWQPLAAHGVSVLAGAIWSFGLNAVYNFDTTDHLRRRATAYAMVIGVGSVVSTTVIWLTHDVLGAAPLAAKLSSLPLVFVVQYGLNALITFRPTRKRNPDRR